MFGYRLAVGIDQLLENGPLRHPITRSFTCNGGVCLSEPVIAADQSGARRFRPLLDRPYVDDSPPMRSPEESSAEIRLPSSATVISSSTAATEIVYP